VLVLGISGSIVRMATYDPASWGWCECLANPLATQVEPRTYLGLVDVVTVGEMAALVIGALVLARAGLWRQRGRRSFFATYGLLVASWLLVDAWTLTAGPDVPGALTLFRDSTLVLLAVVYVLGFASQRSSRAHVADLLLAAREEHNSRRLRDLVARAMGDPETVVGWWDSRTGGYLDHRGHDVPLPDVDVLRVEAAGRAIAVVSSDRLPDVDPSVRESVVQALLLAAENRRLTAELEASLEQVRDSRARILTASDDTRRRIERDLHDGAQQLLISTGIKLNLAAAQAERGDAASLTKVIEEAQAELNRALTELRNLASGIAPTALVHGSLENALRELALRSAVPTAVRVSGEEQPDEHTAATLFFLVAECLTNVTKHSGASRATVEVALTSPIRVGVSDDGRGGATFDSSGTGLRGLVDRVEALGGRLHVASAPGGTTVSATIPAGVVETLDR
jgi:signal transduction histidine kinase